MPTVYQYFGLPSPSTKLYAWGPEYHEFESLGNGRNGGILLQTIEIKPHLCSCLFLPQTYRLTTVATKLVKNACSVWNQQSNIHRQLIYCLPACSSLHLISLNWAAVFWKFSGYSVVIEEYNSCVTCQVVRRWANLSVYRWHGTVYSRATLKGHEKVHHSAYFRPSLNWHNVVFSFSVCSWRNYSCEVEEIIVCDDNVVFKLKARCNHIGIYSSTLSGRPNCINGANGGHHSGHLFTH
jgi:hypothetical protein